MFLVKISNVEGGPPPLVTQKRQAFRNPEVKHNEKDFPISLILGDYHSEISQATMAI